MASSLASSRVQENENENENDRFIEYLVDRVSAIQRSTPLTFPQLVTATQTLAVQYRPATTGTRQDSDSLQAFLAWPVIRRIRDLPEKGIWKPLAPLILLYGKLG